MENVLPVEIIRDIFSRLPVECILQWKRVHKTWRNLPLLDDAYFASAQLHRQPRLLLDGDCDEKDDVTGRQLYYHKISASNESNHIKVKFKELGLKPQQLPVDPSFTLVGSCNGLICFAVSDDSTLVSGDPIYICNPVTKEEMYLPRFVDNEMGISKLNFVTVASGFGYIPSTNEYKVVRICAHPNEPIFLRRIRVGYVQVYTLGVDSDWRYKEQLYDHYLWRPNSDQYVSSGVFVDGAIHWLNYYDWKILAFDLSEEVFFEVPSPPCFKDLDVCCDAERIQLQELQGTLCVCSQGIREVCIWLYQKTLTKTNTSSYIVKRDKGGDQYNKTWSRKFFIISHLSGYVEHMPIAFTKSGEILFWYDRTILALFDQKTTFDRILAGGNFGRRVLQVISHVNSFVPLKTLGEKIRK